jgi:hypothetical protein
MPAWPASAAPATDEDTKPIEIVMACEAGRISIGECRSMGTASIDEASETGFSMVMVASFTGMYSPTVRD